jgi:PAS domain S-box-containing protein
MRLQEDGPRLPLSFSVSPFAGAPGRIIRTVVAMDITTPRQAEDAFEKLFTHSPVGIFIARGGKIELVNPGFQAITGYSAAELMAMDPLAMVIPEFKEEVRDKAVRILKGERSLPYEFPFITKSGETGWAMGTVVSTLYQGERATLAYFMDITMRKRAEEALKKSEHKYRELVENANSIILRLSKDGKVTFLNEFGQKFFGYTEDEIIGRHVIGTIVPETESTGRNLQPIMEEICTDPKKFENNVNENIRRNGERVWIAWTNKMILDNQGQLVEVLSIGSDITERKRAEEALKEREATLNGILRTTPIGIGLVYNRALAWANDHLSTITGYSLDDLQGRDSRRLYKSDAEYERVGRVYQTLTATGVESVVTCWQRRDGKDIDIWLSLSPLDPADLAAGVVVAVMDITDRKQAEEKLKQQTEELAALNALAHRVGACLSLEELVAAALDPTVYTIAPDLALLYVRENDHLTLQGTRPDRLALSCSQANLRTGECLCGLASQEGKPIYSSNIQADPRCALTACKEAGIRSFAALTLVSGERLLGVLGLAWAQEQDLQAQAGFLETIAGEVAMGLNNALLYRELQEHASELDQRVRERTVQLRAANKELEAFAYSISHDLRAPLRAVSGFAQIIARRHKAALNEEGRHYVDNIVLAAERMGHLIDDLLAYSRLGRQALTIRHLDLKEVIRQVLNDLNARVAATGAVVEVAEDLPWVPGDPTLLQQIFTNLLDNALTYRQPEVAPVIRITWRPDAGQIVLAVSDNGIGIEPAYHEKIFNAFQRLHSDEDYPGTGIGLAIVKKSVIMLGGQVWVESEVGKGSTFYIKMPKE